jgi:hypothetical protein
MITIVSTEKNYKKCILETGIVLKKAQKIYIKE